ncbi:hypothetical protein BDV23DRAFT_190755 [Aspergillus alliaceus]|uniref:Uncharacterized protein n=1 Tax=Petromyces alliaceus TaxID=209559 RepID=A0A5N7CIX1_PETAA|nr:hypothetical protein BDV23DRAFT_190755 [Aspergillus alliaceus]
MISTMQSLSGSVSSVLGDSTKAKSEGIKKVTDSPSFPDETDGDHGVGIAVNCDRVNIMTRPSHSSLPGCDNSQTELTNDSLNALRLGSIPSYTNGFNQQLPNVVWSFEYQMGLEPYPNAFFSSQQASITLSKVWTESNSPFSDHIQVLQNFMRSKLDLIRPLFELSPQPLYQQTRFYHIVDLTAWQIYLCTTNLDKVHQQYRLTEMQLQQQYPQVIDRIGLSSAMPSAAMSEYMADLVIGAPAVTAYIRVTDVTANISSTTPGSELDPSAVFPAPDAAAIFSSPEFSRAVFKKLGVDRGISHYKVDPAFFGTYPELYDPSVDIAAKGIPLKPDVQWRLAYPEPLDSSTFQAYRSFMIFNFSVDASAIGSNWDARLVH